jgi:hypothetical protein
MRAKITKLGVVSQHNQKVFNLAASWRLLVNNSASSVRSITNLAQVSTIFSEKELWRKFQGMSRDFKPMMECQKTSDEVLFDYVYHIYYI